MGSGSEIRDPEKNLPAFRIPDPDPGSESATLLATVHPETVWRIRDVYPGSRILIFTHPGSRIQKQQQKRGMEKKIVILFLSQKFHKILFYFLNAEEKNLGQFSKNN
jgi:hypothetical protein